MQISFFQALLIALFAFWIESPLTLNTRFFAFGRPLVSGLIIGLILGDPVKGTMIGATINAVYIGVIIVGEQTPVDTRLAGVLGPAFGIIAGLTPEVALATIVPIAVLANLTRPLRQSLFSLIAHKADQYALDDNPKGIAMINVLAPTITALLYPGLVVFLAVYYGSGSVESIISLFPAGVVNGFAAVGKLLPALGYAILLHYLMGNNLKAFPWFFIGFIFAGFLGLDILAVVGLGIAAAFIIYGQDDSGKEGLSK
jgi:mannose/fructose/N-acetylgalactosamine-specific phosphotransferase system component IIC